MATSSVTKFKCPRCASHYFGSHAASGPQEAQYPAGTLIGSCHGMSHAMTSNQLHCTFTWVRTPEMDALMFVPSESNIDKRLEINVVGTTTGRTSGTIENQSNEPKSAKH